jgi:NAD+ synthase (glutamine-hydrolysing)
MKIALAQLNYHVGNFPQNTKKILHFINRGRDEKADLVVFSELSVTGYYPHDLLEKMEFVSEAAAAVQTLAKHCRGIAAIVGAPTINEDERGKKLFNSALFLADGKVRSMHHKTLLPTYDIFDEYRHFEPNKQFKVVDFKGEKLAITLCEDLWDEQPTSNEFGKDKLYQASPLEELSRQHPGVVINIAASPFSCNQENWRKDILVRNARQYGLPLIYVNQVGANAELIYDGGSVVIDSQGAIIRELKYFKEDFKVIDTDTLKGQEWQPRMNAIEKIHHALVLGIRDYFRKSGFTSAILGLSGGIDSAVTLALAVRALGAGNVRALLMPSAFSSAHSVEDARQLADNLNVRYDIIPIQDAVDRFNERLTPIFNGLPADSTEENIQARTRGVYLMALSNKFGNILLNTTNKSECAVGYGTLYGDMNGGLAVLGDVYKTDVFQLARYINREQAVIPENTLLKPPSAELKEGQKDSDTLPEYEVLDSILYHYIELNLPPEEICKKGFPEETVVRVIRMVNTSEYKRFQAAPILRVSSKAFGFGRKMPIVANYE